MLFIDCRYRRLGEQVHSGYSDRIGKRIRKGTRPVSPLRREQRSTTGRYLEMRQLLKKKEKEK